MNATAYDLNSRIVAHRGYPALYPENTLIGLHAALEAGAKAVEFDVQCSADGTPYVFHDDNLTRLTGDNGHIYSRSDAYIEQLFAHYPSRFGDRYAGNRVSSLQQVITLLREFPGVDVFIEPKIHSLDYFGVEPTMDAILQLSASLGQRRHIISFHYAALRYARDSGCPSIAWVLSDFSSDTERLARQLGADILCADAKIIPGQLPHWGDNDWMVYTADDIATIESLAAQGFRWIETDDIGAVLATLEKRGTHR